MISITTIRGPAANEKVNDFSSYASAIFPNLRNTGRINRNCAFAVHADGRQNPASAMIDKGWSPMVLAALETYFLASPGCSRELALLAFGKLAERVDLIALVETGAGDVVEDGHLLGASYIAGDGAPPFAGLYGDVGHERFSSSHFENLIWPLPISGRRRADRAGLASLVGCSRSRLFGVASKEPSLL